MTISVRNLNQVTAGSVLKKISESLKNYV